MNAVPPTSFALRRQLTGKDEKSVLIHLLDGTVRIPLSTMDMA
jgi:hypothetical protein